MKTPVEHSFEIEQVSELSRWDKEIELVLRVGGAAFGDARFTLTPGLRAAMHRAVSASSADDARLQAGHSLLELLEELHQGELPELGGGPEFLTFSTRSRLLYSLPWSLLPLGRGGVAVLADPQILVRHRWPGSASAPPSALIGGASWSGIPNVLLACGGLVQAGQHLQAIEAAQSSGRCELLEGLSRGALGEAMRQAVQEEVPYSVLHLVCPGGLRGGALQLRWGEDTLEPEDLVQELSGLGDTLRLVIISAISEAVSLDMDPLRSPGIHLHRGVAGRGIEWVVAARVPMPAAASVRLTEGLHAGLEQSPLGVAGAYLSARESLRGGASPQLAGAMMLLSTRSSLLPEEMDPQQRTMNALDTQLRARAEGWLTEPPDTDELDDLAPDPDEEPSQAGPQLQRGMGLLFDPQTQQHRFELIEELGRGASSRVWSAVDEVLKKQVAIKLFHPELLHDQAAQERLARGIRDQARLGEHPVYGVYFVQVVEQYLEELPLRFTVLEYMLGGDLGSAVREGELDSFQLLDALLSVCRALEAVHNEGLVHRHINPGNVLLDALGGAHLADLDLVWVPPNQQVAPVFFAPEALEHADSLGPRGDLYALAMLVVFCLHGDTPPAASDAGWQEFVTGLPGNPKLHQLLTQALSTDPMQRQDSVLEFRVRLQRAWGAEWRRALGEAPRQSRASDESSAVYFLPPPSSHLQAVVAEPAPTRAPLRLPPIGSVNKGVDTDPPTEPADDPATDPPFIPFAEHPADAVHEQAFDPPTEPNDSGGGSPLPPPIAAPTLPFAAPTLPFAAPTPLVAAPRPEAPRPPSVGPVLQPKPAPYVPADHERIDRRPAHRLMVLVLVLALLLSASLLWWAWTTPVNPGAGPVVSTSPPVASVPVSKVMAPVAPVPPEEAETAEPLVEAPPEPPEGVEPVGQPTVAEIAEVATLIAPATASTKPAVEPVVPAAAASPAASPAESPGGAQVRFDFGPDSEGHYVELSGSGGRRVLGLGRQTELQEGAWTVQVIRSNGPALNFSVHVPACGQLRVVEAPTGAADGAFGALAVGVSGASASWWVGGHNYGAPSGQLSNFPAGDHAVTLRAEGHPLQQFTVKVGPGSRSERHYSLGCSPPG